ncbi:MAG: alpha/beta fold hydrolase [Pseudomonadota bacterium]
MEKPISFQVKDATLFGILHLPEAEPTERPELGLVFVHSGSRGRLGNTFHYPFFARHLAKLGYPVLRFDPAGIGDSTGEPDRCPMNDFYGKIQVGKFVDETLVAIEEFHRLVNPKRIVLFGICGGAITALLTGPRSQLVDALVLLSIPVLLDSSQQSQIDRIPKEFARKYLISLYARKLLSLKAWKRLLLFQSETGAIWTYLKAAIKGPGAKAKSSVDSENQNMRFNKYFLEALDSTMERSNPALFLFGEEDEFRWEFEREFYNVYWEKNPAYKRLCDIHFFPFCNHMFTLREWQQQALKVTELWLEKLAKTD